MAYNQFDLGQAQTQSITTGLKTVMGIFAATNVVVKGMEVSASFDGSTSGNAPAQCEFEQITFATNAPGTNSSAATLRKQDAGRGETIQATGGFTWTAQPTVITVQWPIAVGQYNGTYTYACRRAA